MTGISIGIGIGSGVVASSAPPDLTPQNFQATPTDRGIDFTWDADGNLGYALLINQTDDVNSASAVTFMIPAGTSYSLSTTDNQMPGTYPPPATGSRYYYWLKGTDGAGNEVTGPSASVAARAFVTLTNGSSATLYVPDWATMTWGTVLFASVATPTDMQMTNGRTGTYDAGSSAWFDTDTFDDITNEAFSGTFVITNFSGVSFTFWISSHEIHPNNKHNWRGFPLS